MTSSCSARRKISRGQIHEHNHGPCSSSILLLSTSSCSMNLKVARRLRVSISKAEMAQFVPALSA